MKCSQQKIDLVSHLKQNLFDMKNTTRIKHARKTLVKEPN